MTYQQFVKKNLKYYIRHGLHPNDAMRMVARDWWELKYGRNPARPRCLRCGHLLRKETYWYCPGCGIAPNPAELYEQFHGAPPMKVRKIKYQPPRPGEQLIKVGRLRELQYEPEFPSRRRGVRYTHKFGDYGTMKFGKNHPILAVSKDGKHLYVINDKSSYKFGERGIVG